MILPITIYGMPVLRKVAKEITPDYEKLNEFIQNMYETMDRAEGVGLAAPQVNKSIRIFVVDASPLSDDNPELEGFRKVFINANIVEQTGKEWAYSEGCLSIPGIREEVKRPEKIRIQYYDENFKHFDEEYDGIKARIIQHEYDHIEGVLFTDKISPIRKRMLKNKLNAVAKGKVTCNYKTQKPLA